MNPAFHPHTRDELERLAARPPHAIGLYGETGVGLVTAATHLATRMSAEIQFVYPERADTVDRVKGSINIDIIRRLYELTRGRSSRHRAVIIVAADTMSPEAQNAFLKLLEEPARDTSFILLIHHANRLLATVRSRLQSYRIRPLDTAQSEHLLDRLGVTDATRRQQLLFIANGRPALMTRLVQDEKAFEAEAELLRKARRYIQGSTYEKLVVCQEVKDSREAACKLVEYAMTIVRFDVMKRRTATSDLLALLDRLERALNALVGNGNIRLVLSRAIL